MQPKPCDSNLQIKAKLKRQRLVQSIQFNHRSKHAIALNYQCFNSDTQLGFYNSYLTSNSMSLVFFSSFPLIFLFDYIRA